MCFWIVCQKSGANAFPWSISQFLCTCHDVFVTMTLYDKFISSMMILPGMFFFVAVVQNCLSYLGSFGLPAWISGLLFFCFCEPATGILKGILLGLQITCNRFHYITSADPWAWGSSQLFVFYKCCFSHLFTASEVFSAQLFTFLLRCLFVGFFSATINIIIFLISFSSWQLIKEENKLRRRENLLLTVYLTDA